MQYELSLHFHQQLKRRDLIASEAMETLYNPQQIVYLSPDQQAFQSIFSTGGKRYMIRVIVSLGRDPEKAITVYKTSKIDKYWK